MKFENFSGHDGWRSVLDFRSAGLDGLAMLLLARDDLASGEFSDTLRVSLVWLSVQTVLLLLHVSASEVVALLLLLVNSWLGGISDQS